MRNNKYFAHSSKNGEKEPLHEHLILVAERASKYAAAFDAPSEAYLAGLLHDLGKYGDLFQRRLNNEESGIDHWSAGAWVALDKYKINGIATSLSIQGHHIGLQTGSKESLALLNPDILQSNHPQGLRLSETDINKLILLLQNDNISLPLFKTNSLYKWGLNNASSMLDVRMLFSCLVDADCIETEAWFKMENGKRQYHKNGKQSLDAIINLSRLISYLNKSIVSPHASTDILNLRSELLHYSLENAKCPQGIFTLTAPTGSGKTLSMLAFSLAHAIEHNLQHIIFVIPYLNIIEQTVQAYSKISELNKYILEHHSLVSTRNRESRPKQILTENWDSPIIITTNIQFLESLFSDKPGTCRKLHNLANSIILFDEAQTIPTTLAVPTLATLSHLSERYKSTIVFATATQPAFNHLNTAILKHCANGWKPHEIVPNVPKIFAKAKRTEITWTNKPVSWENLAKEMCQFNQVMCIVNLKRHAQNLFTHLKKINSKPIFHLSTNMCPAHRSDILVNIRKLLDEGTSCHLVSTQCVEAGVDIDFPVVYRALGPLDAIAQVAGRCNRNGLLKIGNVHIFKPETLTKENIYPDKLYEQATAITNSLLMEFSIEGLDINNPDIFNRYYRQLYDIRGISSEDNNNPIFNAIARQDFSEVAQIYKIINRNTINLLVPYNPDIFQQLKDEVLQNGLDKQWILKAQPYVVSIFEPKFGDPIFLSLQSIKLKYNAEDSDEWYIYNKVDDYDNDIGLNPSLLPNLIIA